MTSRVSSDHLVLGLGAHNKHTIRLTRTCCLVMLSPTRAGPVKVFEGGPYVPSPLVRRRNALRSSRCPVYFSAVRTSASLKRSARDGMMTARRAAGGTQGRSARIRFLGDWQERLDGALCRGASLIVEFDPSRLSHCRQEWRGAQVWNIEALVRVHPRGEIWRGTVLKARREPPDTGMVVAMEPAPFVMSLPWDTTQLEVWFHNFYETSSRCDALDSRFGGNYWFDVGGDPPRAPRVSVGPRWGAITRPDVVNVTRQEIVKKNVFPRAPTGATAGTDLQTLASVLVWVKNVTYLKNVWMDLHVFDQTNERIHSETLTLGYARSAGGEGDLFAFEGTVFQGSTATPGSLSPKSDASTLQYRVYREVSGQVFTDGILHQPSLAADAVIR